MKEKTLSCIEVETLKEAEMYCKENKKRPDVIIINGAYFIGYLQGSDTDYHFYFNNHHLTFSINSGIYINEEDNFKVHTYNFEKCEKIDWIELQ